MDALLPSVPMATLTPAAHHLGHLADLGDAVRHLERGRRAVGDAAAVPAEERDLVVVDVDAVHEHDVGPEHAELGEVLERPLAELGEESVGIDRGRRHVEVQPGVRSGRPRPWRPATARRCRSCGRRSSTTPGCARRPRGDGPSASASRLRDRLVGRLAVHLGLGRQVPDPLADAAPGCRSRRGRRRRRRRTRTVPASRNDVVPDFSISAAASCADSRSSSSVWTEYSGHEPLRRRSPRTACRRARSRGSAARR